jgi:photosystem II stability/assembly factor-like uncharacterized protein
MKRMIYLLIFSCGLHLCAIAQSSNRIGSYRKLQQQASPFGKLAFRNIGPTIMSGRVTDIEVNPGNPTEFYVAYASGGVWHTLNNGQTFTPIFDKEATHTIGDMAMDWKNHTLWVGTGEVNSSRSSYAGTGVYKTSDTGKTWTHAGLDESHHIGRIVLHPTNTLVAWVAVLGHLYTKHPERGIFKTTDGGKSWTKTLFINDSTGCVDLLIDPLSPDILYTSTWTRSRVPWHFNGSGEGSGIYKSTNGGERWTLLTDGKNGFPTGKGVGRIGISLCDRQPNILYALLDNQNNQEEKKDVIKDMNAKTLQDMSVESFLALDDTKLEAYLRDNGYPEKYTAAGTKEAVLNKIYTVRDIADWKLADADANLFDTPIIGAELYRSDDAGKTWKKTHDKLLEGVYFTYGYYFGTVAVSPQEPNQVWIAGYPVLLSEDGGKTFTQKDGENCHPDYHRIWINPINDKHIISGNDGGINISYDRGSSWIKANNPAVGQFYAVQVDDNTPYNVYGGLQDNGTWTGPSRHVESTAWHQTGAYPYKVIGDGDGMQVQVDTRDNQTAYVGYQFGNYFRINTQKGEELAIKPVHDIGEKPYRFNWQTPILLSKHLQDIFYIGSNCMHRSLKKGDQLSTISTDLTANKQKGSIPYGTLTSISESPLRFGLLYTGSDDGFIFCSKDVGTSWTKISNSLPQDKWVSRVIASKHQESRVYATLNGYRQDDFTPYVYVSDNYGKSWQQIGKTLPDEPVNVIREDPKNENIIYVGTDNGLYVSIDRGVNFMPWDAELPRVAIHDMVIQERENELVLGTHGRSIYIANLDAVQAYPTFRQQQLALMPVQEVPYRKNLGKTYDAYSKPVATNVDIVYYTQTAGPHDVKIEQKNGKSLYTIKHEAVVGYNVLSYNLQVNETALKALNPKPEKADDGNYYLPAGAYLIRIKGPAGNATQTELNIVDKKDK